LFVGLVLVSLFSVTLGSVRVPFSHALKIVAAKLPLGIHHGWSETEEIIVLKVRLPRILLGIIVGAGLSVAGVIFQGLLRNPLSDPFILGTSSGAALGATLALTLGIGGLLLGNFALPVVAFLGSFLAMLFVYNLAQVGGRVGLETLLLSGVIVNAFLSSLVMFIMSLARRDASAILFWLMGSLAEVDWTLIKVVYGYITVSLCVLYFYSRELNLLALGEEQAQHLGVEIEKVKKILFFVVSLVVGACVSSSGMIGFIGLMVPHISRLLLGPDHHLLIPCSALCGGIIMVAADTLARTVFAPVEIPVGIITALAGTPFFIYLLRRRRRG
jgi:iron complex transport system permease protein